MEMSRSDKLSLMSFMCNAAWGDVEIQPEERNYILKLADKLAMSDEDIDTINGWLKSPPPIDDVDPTVIPQRLRETFLKQMEAIIAVDGVITDDESEMISLVKALLSGN